MRCRLRNRTLASLVGGCLTLGLWSGDVAAQSPAEMNARIHALERQNAQLRQAMQQRSMRHGPVQQMSYVEYEPQMMPPTTAASLPATNSPATSRGPEMIPMMAPSMLMAPPPQGTPHSAVPQIASQPNAVRLSGPQTLPSPASTSWPATPPAVPQQTPFYESASHDSFPPMGDLSQYPSYGEQSWGHGSSSTCTNENCPECRKKKASHDSIPMRAAWNNGLELKTDDGHFRIHVGGRSQVDAVFLSGSTAAFQDTGPGKGDGDSINLRRGRLRVDGTMFEIIDFACEYDFINQFNNQPGFNPISEADAHAVPAPTDFWVNVRDVPIVGNVKAGNFKEPIGFDHLHSSRYLNFLERSFSQDAFNGPFNNGFSPGIMIWDTFADEYGTWATGIFKNGTNIYAYGVGDGEYAWTSRVTSLLYYDESSHGANLLHIGLAGSLRDANNNQVQYRSRGSLRNGPPGPLNPVFANTGVFYAESASLLNAEFSWQWGPLLVNAEYEANFNSDAIGNGVSSVAGAPLGNVFFHCWHVETLYFLTGEHREYERKAGVYGRVVPHRNFGWFDGPGAWQIGARYSQLDLRDTGINGGFLQDVTLGLNWFLNPNTKVQWNYVYMDRDEVGTSPGGSVHGAGIRLAFDF